MVWQWSIAEHDNPIFFCTCFAEFPPSSAILRSKGGKHRRSIAFWTEQSFIYIGSVPLAVEVSQYHNCCAILLCSPMLQSRVLRKTQGEQDLNGVMLMLLPVAGSCIPSLLTEGMHSK